MAHIPERRAQTCEIPCEKVTELSEMMIELKGTVGRIKKDLYNGDDNPDAGLVPEIRSWLIEERAARSRRWKRSDKIAAIAIFVVVMLPPVTWSTAKTVKFLNTLSQIAQEWEQLHHSQIHPPQSMFAPADPVLALKRAIPQAAGNSAAYTATVR